MLLDGQFGLPCAKPWPMNHAAGATGPNALQMETGKNAAPRNYEILSFAQDLGSRCGAQ
jgi:hypothetical protein